MGLYVDFEFAERRSTNPEWAKDERVSCQSLSALLSLDTVTRKELVHLRSQGFYPSFVRQWYERERWSTKPYLRHVGLWVSKRVASCYGSPGPPGRLSDRLYRWSWSQIEWPWGSAPFHPKEAILWANAWIGALRAKSDQDLERFILVKLGMGPQGYESPQDTRETANGCTAWLLEDLDRVARLAEHANKAGVRLKMGICD